MVEVTLFAARRAIRPDRGRSRAGIIFPHRRGVVKASNGAPGDGKRVGVKTIQVPARIENGAVAHDVAVGFPKGAEPAQIVGVEMVLALGLEGVQPPVPFQKVVHFGAVGRAPVVVPDSSGEVVELSPDFPGDECLENCAALRRDEQRLRRGNAQQVRLDSGVGQNALWLPRQALDGVSLPRRQFTPLERRLENAQPFFRRGRGYADFAPELRAVDFLRGKRRRQGEKAESCLYFTTWTYYFASYFSVI